MGFEYFVRRIGRPERAVVWPMADFAGDETEHLLAELERVGVSDLALVPVKLKVWDRDLIPWPAPQEDGSCRISNGPDTLRWIEKDLLPALRQELTEDIPFYIAGYSLAGLFALWSMYESEAFAGAVCCSPSVWYDDWDRYTEERTVKGRDKCIYLSLGGREEKTSNPVMAKVGDRIRRQEKLLRADPHVRRVMLEWNAGGHFADSGKRLAKGIAALRNMGGAGAGDRA